MPDSVLQFDYHALVYRGYTGQIYNADSAIEGFPTHAFMIYENMWGIEYSAGVYLNPSSHSGLTYEEFEQWAAEYFNSHLPLSIGEM